MNWRDIPDDLYNAFAPPAQQGMSGADYMRGVIRNESTPDRLMQTAMVGTGGGGFAGPIKMGLFTMPSAAKNYVAKEFPTVADAFKAGWKRGMSPYPEIELTPNINPSASELRLKWDDAADRYLTDWVGTRPEYRRQGLASQLWRQAKELLGYDPTPEYILQNKMAPGFWQKQGYGSGLRQDTWADDIIRGNKR